MRDTDLHSIWDAPDPFSAPCKTIHGCVPIPRRRSARHVGRRCPHKTMKPTVGDLLAAGLDPTVRVCQSEECGRKTTQLRRDGERVATDRPWRPMGHLPKIPQEFESQGRNWAYRSPVQRIFKVPAKRQAAESWKVNLMIITLQERALSHYP